MPLPTVLHAASTRPISLDRGNVLPAPLLRAHLDVARADLREVWTYYVIPRLALACNNIETLKSCFK